MNDGAELLRNYVRPTRSGLEPQISPITQIPKTEIDSGHSATPESFLLAQASARVNPGLLHATFGDGGIAPPGLSSIRLEPFLALEEGHHA
jgi:hypothetical protein